MPNIEFSSLEVSSHQNAIVVADEDVCPELKVGTYKYFECIESKDDHPKESR